MLFIEDDRWFDVDGNCRYGGDGRNVSTYIGARCEEYSHPTRLVRLRETISCHFDLVLLAMLRLHDELLNKPQPVTNT